MKIFLLLILNVYSHQSILESGRTIKLTTLQEIKDKFITFIENIWSA